MDLEITPTAVRFRGRPIEGAVPDTFEVLAAPYARDARRVYLVMAAKVKPLTQPDPQTFESLGEGYGRDAEAGYFHGKRLRLKKGPGSLAQLRPVGYHMATDGHWLYFEAKHVAPPDEHGLDLSATTYRHFAVAPHYFHDGLLSDGRRHWLYVWNVGWRDLGDVAAAALRPLGQEVIGLGRPRYVSDGSRVFFDGEAVPAARGKRLRQVGFATLDVDGRLFVGTAETTLESADVRWLDQDDYRLADGSIARLRPGVAPEVLAPAAPAPPLPEAAQRLLDEVIPAVASALDRYLPVETSPQDIDFGVAAPGGPVDFRLEAPTAAELRLRVGDEIATAEPTGVYGLACTAWAAARGERSRLVAYVNYATSYPDVDALQQRLVRTFPLGFAHYAAALHTAGASEAARVLTHLIARAHRHDRELRPDLLAALPPGAGELLRRSLPHAEVGRTTNLAVVREMCGPDWLAHADPVRRLEALAFLGGAVAASNKATQTVTVALPALETRLQVESVGLVREGLQTSLEVAAVQVQLAAEMGHRYDYPLLERVAAAAVRAGVNVDLNAVRRCEALYGQAPSAVGPTAPVGFEEARATLLAGVARRRPCPGVYVYRVRYQSYATAVLAAQVRALPARKLEGAALAAEVEQLRADLAALAEAEGGASERADLARIAAELQALRQ